MPYTIHSWPPGLPKDEIEALPMEAQAAIAVMFREMRRRGPRPEEYNVKPLSRRLRGLNQANMKINREQIRLLFSVYGTRIVIFHVFKKTSPQLEQRGYDKALARKRSAESLMAGAQHVIPTIH